MRHARRGSSGVVASSISDVRPKPASDPSAERGVLNDWFPELQNEDFGVASEGTPGGGYNCVAWGAGDCTREWSPNAKPGDPPHKIGGYFWPTDLPYNTSKETMLALYRRLGYEECHSIEFEEGIEKVAFYGEQDNIDHVARQGEQGEWLSKMGEGADITHDDPLEVVKCFGEIITVMCRPRSEADDPRPAYDRVRQARQKPN